MIVTIITLIMLYNINRNNITGNIVTNYNNDDNRHNNSNEL